MSKNSCEAAEKRWKRVLRMLPSACGGFGRGLNCYISRLFYEYEEKMEGLFKHMLKISFPKRCIAVS